MKMKTLAAAAAAFTLTAGIFAPSVVRAEQDFTQYTNEELLQQRTQVRDMSEGDRAQFRAEMQKRTQNMSAEERERQRSESGDGYGRGYGTRQGANGGGMSGGMGGAGMG